MGHVHDNSFVSSTAPPTTAGGPEGPDSRRTTCAPGSGDAVEDLLPRQELRRPSLRDGLPARRRSLGLHEGADDSHRARGQHRAAAAEPEHPCRARSGAGLVIGKPARFVSAADAFDDILGYTCANDVSARDLQRSDPQLTRGKGFDTFCPVGPGSKPTSTRLPASGCGAASTALASRRIDRRHDLRTSVPHRVPHRVCDSVPRRSHLTGSPGGTEPLTPATRSTSRSRASARSQRRRRQRPSLTYPPNGRAPGPPQTRGHVAESRSAFRTHRV